MEVGGCPWSTFYRSRLLSREYLEYANQKYMEHISAVISNIRGGDAVLEVGCGLGTITKILQENVPYAHFCASDSSRAMLTMAKANMGTAPVALFRHNAMLPAPGYDVVHSHGLLEHFQDHEVRAVIAAAKGSGARATVHYVPGDRYVRPSFGDERLLPLEFWRDTFKPTEGFSFNGGYDYCLIWRF